MCLWFKCHENWKYVLPQGKTAPTKKETGISDENQKIGLKF